MIWDILSLLQAEKDANMRIFTLRKVFSEEKAKSVSGQTFASALE